MATENTFPTIRHLRDRLNDLVEWGVGDHPVQVLVVPDSTLQAIARVSAPPGYDAGKKPALMVEMDSAPGHIGVSILSTDRWQGHGVPPGTQ